MKRFAKLALCLTLIVPAGVAGTSTAEALPADWEVLAGAVHPTNPEAKYEYTRFYPEMLRVRRGQIVRWTFHGPNLRLGSEPYGLHTVSFLPGQDRAGNNILREDEYATVGFRDDVFFGSRCGRTGQPLCEVSSTDDFVSSGFTSVFDASPFRARIDLPQGTYSYFCLIYPEMNGTIEVVPSATTLPSQAQIDQIVEQQIAEDSANADARVAELSEPRSEVVDGIRTWDVHAGAFTEDAHVELPKFLPASLPIEAGDRVRFLATDFVHNVAFPANLVGGPTPAPHGLGGLAILPSCDFDEPTGGAPGVIGLWRIRMPDCPAHLELLYMPWVARVVRAPGNAILSEASYHNSGIIASSSFPDTHRPPAVTGLTWATGFDADFPVAGTFAFRCMVHPALMTGSITVT